MYGIKSGKSFVETFDGNGTTRWTSDPSQGRRFKNRTFAASCVEDGEQFIRWTGETTYEQEPLLDPALDY